MQYILTEQEYQDSKYGIYTIGSIKKIEKGSVRTSGEGQPEIDCVIVSLSNGKNGANVIFTKEDIEKLAFQFKP